MTCSHNDEVICIDPVEHRVLVFSREFIFRYQIGGKGEADGQFNEPSDIILNEVGRLYVADKNNYRLQMFTEQKKFKEAKKGISFSGGSSLASKLKSNFKTGTEYTFKETIRLSDKPIKICSAPFAPVIAIGTENGYFFILNETNQVTSYLKLKQFDRADMRTMCLNESGDKLICLKSKENDLYLKFYKIDKIYEEDKYSFNSSGFGNKASEDGGLKKLEFLNKVKLEKNYLPGISLNKPTNLKLSLDFQYLLIYDSVNFNLLEYKFDGKLNKLLLKAEEHLGNVLGMDFSGDRNHLVTTEFEINPRYSLLKPKSEPNKKDDSNEMSSHEVDFRKRSLAYVFKLKSYRYRDCECHRHLVPKSKSRISMGNRSANFNQSSNNFSSISDSGNL